MNFSELVLHYGYNIKAFNDLFRRGQKQKPFKNFSFEAHQSFSPKKMESKHWKKEMKTELKQHIKPNNNPRLRLIQKTKELINEKATQKQVAQQNRATTPGGIFRNRYLSSSMSSRKSGRYSQFVNRSIELIDDDHDMKEYFRNKFLQSTIQKMKINKVIEEPKQEPPEVLSVKVNRQFPGRKKFTKLNVEGTKRKQKDSSKEQEERRPNTTTLLMKPRKRADSEIQPW